MSDIEYEIWKFIERSSWGAMQSTTPEASQPDQWKHQRSRLVEWTYHSTAGLSRSALRPLRVADKGMVAG